jgi:Cu-processing system permease protein
MFRRVFAIAFNTYRESVRARILLGLAGVAFLVSFYSLIVGAFTLRNAPRVVSDLGTASMSLFGIAVAMIIAATSLHRELEQKTVFPILARPIHRAEYIVGKYIGTLLTIAVFIMADAGLILLLSAGLSVSDPTRVIVAGAVAVALLAVALVKSPSWRTLAPIPWSALMLVLGLVLASQAAEERRVVAAASALAFAEIAVVAALATFFASFTTPFLSTLFTLGVWIVGRSADSLERLPVKFFGRALHESGRAMAKIVPNLHVYVPARPLLVGETPDVRLAPYMARASLAALAWAVLLLAVASLIFKRRDFL